MRTRFLCVRKGCPRKWAAGTWRFLTVTATRPPTGKEAEGVR